MKKIIFLLCLASSCAAAAPKDAQLISTAKTRLQYDLKDPESARYRNVVVIRENVCGEFNAKNSMGGYVGFKRFMAIGGQVVFVEGEGANFESLWSGICLKNPPKPKPPPQYYEESWKDMK